MVPLRRKNASVRGKIPNPKIPTPILLQSDTQTNDFILINLNPKLSFPFIILMQLLRFESQNIFVLEKSVEFCGKTIIKYPLANNRSKKKVKWMLKHNEDIHLITCSISFYSGKKRVTHNGHTIMDIIDTRESVDFIVLMGFQKMIFTVDINTE